MILNFEKSTHESHQRPISYCEKGKLAVINGSCANKDKVKEGETWKCELVEEKQFFYVVNPLSVVPEEEVKGSFNEKIEALKNKWNCKN
ncbi:MAG: hypothetical protein WCI04_06335 [archaeon]